MIQLLPNERIDDLQCKGYQIIQKTDGFCFGMDAVLLADFTKKKANGIYLDLGTGTGIIPILLEAREKGSYFTGVEIQPEYVEMANRSVKMNGLEDHVQMIEGDIKTVSEQFKGKLFDVITSNPPYMISEHGLTNPTQSKAIARHEILCNFEDIARESKKLLKEKGSLCIVHRTFRLADLIYTLKKYGLEPKRMRLVHPYADQEPNLVLLEAVKGGKSRLKIEPPLVVYKEQNKYTDEIYKIYQQS